MKRPDREQQKAIVKQWKHASNALEAVQKDELASWEYDWNVVDALLEIAARYGESRASSGLVEMQHLFSKHRQ